MKTKHGVHAKMIQRTAGTCFILISKQSIETLKLRPQDPNCLLVEVPDPIKRQLVYQIVKLGT